MDPNAALNDVIVALVDKDLEAAQEAFSDLSDWIRKGGFAPMDPRTSRQPDGEQAAKVVARFVNVMSADHKEFVDTVMQEHRTLQQLIFGLFLACVARWAEEGHYDGRNEFTVQKSKEIVEALGKYNLRPPVI